MPATRSSRRVQKTPAKNGAVSLSASRRKPATTGKDPEKPIHVCSHQPAHTPNPAPAEPALISNPSQPPLIQPEPIHPATAAAGLNLTERPTSHPYLVPTPLEPSTTRTTSGLFVSDLDIPSLQPRSTPNFSPSPSILDRKPPNPKIPSIFSGNQISAPRPPPTFPSLPTPAPALPRHLTSSPLARSRSTSRTNSPILLRSVSPALKGLTFHDSRILPQDLEIAYFAGLTSSGPGAAAMDFDLVLIFNDHHIPPKTIKAVPVMFFTGLVRMLGDWCLPWYRGGRDVDWEEVLQVRRDDEGLFRREGGWERWLGRVGENVRVG